MNKSTRNLLIIFVILFAVVYFFFKSKEKESTQDIDAKIFVADSSKIDKIEIVKPKETIVLEKAGGVWKLTKPVDYLADTSAIVPMVSNLQNLVVESVISTNPEKFSNYIDSTNQTQITVYQEGKQLGTFTMGKTASVFDHTYIKLPNEERILLATNLASPHFNRAVREFRDKKIASIQSFNINSIDFKSTDSNQVNFTAVKDSVGKWFIEGDSVNAAMMEGLLNLFASFNTEDFVDSTVTQFPIPIYTISIYGQQPTVINFYKMDKTPVEYMVQVSGHNQLYKFSEGYAASYLKKKKDLLHEKK